MKLCPSCKLRYPEEATQCFVDRTALIAAPDPYLGAVVAAAQVRGGVDGPAGAIGGTGGK